MERVKADAVRVEAAIRHHARIAAAPPRLGAALEHALFPGGARARPRLAIAVARACGDDRPQVSDALAAAVEALHCASLVHDDLPCFDDAALRRGRPSVHAAHGEALAVLAGDGLIVMAFQALSDVAVAAGDRLGALLSIVAESAGVPHGLVAGQAMESEMDAALSSYHAAKTGALFEAAAAGGAAASGGPIAPWQRVGAKLGSAYQIADDIHDRVGEDGALGKPTGQDAANARPNAVDAAGLQGAVATLRATIEESAAAVPDGPMAAEIQTFIRAQADRFVPAALKVEAA